MKLQETHTIVEPQFECDVCGAKFKKEITMKKHFNTKHNKQNWKVCHMTFKDSMEVLKHVAKEHSKNVIETISVKEKEQIINQNEEDISEKEVKIKHSKQFKCYKCKEIVSLNYVQQMCNLCTMTEAYG